VGGCLRWASTRRCVLLYLQPESRFTLQPTPLRLTAVASAAQSIARPLELAGGDEESALALLLDAAVDSTQQQPMQPVDSSQQQPMQPLSVRFAKLPAPPSLPQSRPRDVSTPAPSSARHEAARALEANASACAAPAANAALCEERAAAGSAPAHDSPRAGCDAAAAAGGLHAAAAGEPPRDGDWVLLQHPDDGGAVAFGNVVTREFSLQPPMGCSGGSLFKDTSSAGC
jgi:hypothetical protein